MKTSRQNTILKVIAERNIETQGQLIDALAEYGVKSTQATLSRDIKDLQLVKELNADGRYHYVVSERSANMDHSQRLKKIFKESVTHHTMAQNIIVIKTLPGLASAACSTIDTMQLEGVAGTLAGDDTAFIVMLDNESAKKLCEEIENMI